uniref:translation initiation factor IF-2-like isoform X1 n=1 Tax=Callithrix jacchus TaxID=9483 RepID=UPI00159D3707|nr:translation initiation factor IF-2-like isoform X1 [Callithrix jacchus]
MFVFDSQLYLRRLSPCPAPCLTTGRRSTHVVDGTKEGKIARPAVQVARVERDARPRLSPLPEPGARPRPPGQAGPGRQELSRARASDPQVAPSRLGARLRALRSAGQNRRERGAEAQPDLLISPRQLPPPPSKQEEEEVEEAPRGRGPAPAPPAPARAPCLGERVPAPRRLQPGRVACPAGVGPAQPGPGTAAAHGRGRPGGRDDARSLAPGGGRPGAVGMEVRRRP